MVLALVLLPALASGLGTSKDAMLSDPLAARFGLELPGILALTFVKVAVFVAVMLVVGRRVIPWLLHYVAHTGSRELFRLAVLAIALTFAFGAAHLFGVSLALGAFFAGMILNESPLSQRAAQESLPLRDAFAVLFFVSVGMLFDPTSIVRAPWPLLATLLIIVIGKSVAAYLIVLAFRHPTTTALMISASLAQIGEFSFILAELGTKLNLLPAAGRDLILAGAILSIMLNPLVFAVVDKMTPGLDRRRARRREKAGQPLAPPPEAPPAVPVTKLIDHTILVGGGRVGRIICEALRTAGEPFLVVDTADTVVVALREKGVEAIAGNAARPDVLKSAGLQDASYVIVAIPEPFEAGQIVQQARAVDPDVRIIARAHSDDEVDHLKKLGADVVIMGEREIAQGMIEQLHALQGQLPGGH
jgi:CPA2 family monovalent cation:H+ antiporter-2